MTIAEQLESLHKTRLDLYEAKKQVEEAIRLCETVIAMFVEKNANDAAPNPS